MITSTTPPGARPSSVTSAEPTADRAELLDTALLLSAVSVAFGALSGGLSVTAGLIDQSLGVLGAGLTTLADLTGSVVLIWRFRAERSQPVDGERVESRATAVIAATLALIAAILAFESIAALLDGSRPGGSAIALGSAGLAALGLPPLAYLKRRTALALGSHALRGDSTLSAIGGATAVLALGGLLLFSAFGWWWADRVVALLVAGVAAAESRTLVRSRRA